VRDSIKRKFQAVQKNCAWIRAQKGALLLLLLLL
jgi:hypothetical protein